MSEQPDIEIDLTEGQIRMLLANEFMTVVADVGTGILRIKLCIVKEPRR